MAETIEYPYSRKSAIIAIILPLIFFAITFDNLRFAIRGGLTLIWIVIALAYILFTIFFLYVFFTRFLPAIRNQVALELNKEGIADYQRNIIIEWSDVKDISQEYGRSYSKLVVDLKRETDYGTQVAISLRLVAGKDEEICETTMAYWEETGT